MPMGIHRLQCEVARRADGATENAGLENAGPKNAGQNVFYFLPLSYLYCRGF